MYNTETVFKRFLDTLFVMRNYVIYLFASIALLVTSECFLLREIFGSQQFMPLFMAAAGLVSSIFFVAHISRQYKKNYQDS